MEGLTGSIGQGGGVQKGGERAWQLIVQLHAWEWGVLRGIKGGVGGSRSWRWRTYIMADPLEVAAGVVIIYI